MYIQTFYGVRNLFGIFTDFETWTICWTNYSNDFAKFNGSLEEAKELAKSSVVDLPSPTLRELCVSKQFTSQDADLGKAIVSVLLKMLYGNQQVDPVPLLSPSRWYIKMNPETWSWDSSFPVSKLSFQPPPKNTNNFYFLYDFKGGSEGKVWLACSVNGNLAILKIIQPTEYADHSEKVTDEERNWKKCGFSTVYKFPFMGHWVLVLPFGISLQWLSSSSSSSPHYHHPLLNQFSNEIVSDWNEIDKGIIEWGSKKDALTACVDRCASVKLVHPDIEWRHVVFFPEYRRSFLFWGTPYFVGIRPAFIDLSGMNQAKNIASAREEMNDRLDELLSDLSIEDSESLTLPLRLRLNHDQY